MFTIIETLWRMLVLFVCSVIQFIAAILGGIAFVFGNGCEILRRFSKKVLRKLDAGKYEAKMRTIAE